MVNKLILMLLFLLVCAVGVSAGFGIGCNNTINNCGCDLNETNTIYYLDNNLTCSGGWVEQTANNVTINVNRTGGVIVRYDTTYGFVNNDNKAYYSTKTGEKLTLYLNGTGSEAIFMEDNTVGIGSTWNDFVVNTTREYQQQAMDIEKWRTNLTNFIIDSRGTSIQIDDADYIRIENFSINIGTPSAGATGAGISSYQSRYCNIKNGYFSVYTNTYGFTMYRTQYCNVTNITTQMFLNNRGAITYTGHADQFSIGNIIDGVTVYNASDAFIHTAGASANNKFYNINFTQSGGTSQSRYAHIEVGSSVGDEYENITATYLDNQVRSDAIRVLGGSGSSFKNTFVDCGTTWENSANRGVVNIRQYNTDTTIVNFTHNCSATAFMTLFYISDSTNEKIINSTFNSTSATDICFDGVANAQIINPREWSADYTHSRNTAWTGYFLVGWDRLFIAREKTHNYSLYNVSTVLIPNMTVTGLENIAFDLTDSNGYTNKLPVWEKYCNVTQCYDVGWQLVMTDTLGIGSNVTDGYTVTEEGNTTVPISFTVTDREMGKSCDGYLSGSNVKLHCSWNLRSENQPITGVTGTTNVTNSTGITVCTNATLTEIGQGVYESYCGFPYYGDDSYMMQLETSNYAIYMSEIKAVQNISSASNCGNATDTNQNTIIANQGTIITEVQVINVTVRDINSSTSNLNSIWNYTGTIASNIVGQLNNWTGSNICNVWSDSYCAVRDTTGISP